MIKFRCDAPAPYFLYNPPVWTARTHNELFNRYLHHPAPRSWHSHFAEYIEAPSTSVDVGTSYIDICVMPLECCVPRARHNKVSLWYPLLSTQTSLPSILNGSHSQRTMFQLLSSSSNTTVKSLSLRWVTIFQSLSSSSSTTVKSLSLRRVYWSTLHIGRHWHVEHRYLWNVLTCRIESWWNSFMSYFSTARNASHPNVKYLQPTSHLKHTNSLPKPKKHIKQAFTVF